MYSGRWSLRIAPPALGVPVVQNLVSETLIVLFGETHAVGVVALKMQLGSLK